MINGVHVFIFCCAEYENLVNQCADSIDRYIEDPLLSKYIVSNKNITVDGYKTILDHEFWKLLDPKFKFRTLYNSNHDRQQIFKLNVDKFADGHCLIVDAEVLFLENFSWFQNGKPKLFSSPLSPFTKKYFDTTYEMNGYRHCIEKSFVIDVAIFSTDILKQLRVDVETKNSKTFLSVIDELLLDRERFRLAEFDLYGHYALAKSYVEYIGEIYHITLMDNRDEYSLDELVKILSEKRKQPFISVSIDRCSYTNTMGTPWLSFYYQVKADNWPDCFTEEEFDLLPKWIQTECIEVHGYQKNV